MVQAATATRFTAMRTVRAPAIMAALSLALAACATSQSVVNPADPNAAQATAADIGSLSTVIQQNPSDPVPYNVRGTAYGQVGKTKEAKADFDRAIALKPDFYQAYANRALVERDMGRDDLAFADYQQAIVLNASYEAAYVGRGNMYRLRGQYDFALADFGRAISLDSNDPRAYHNRGLLYQAIGRHDPAIDDFSKAISLAPGNSEPFNARGLSYLAVGDAKAALDDFNVVVMRDMASYIGWTNQGLALEKLGQLDKANAAFVYAASVNPKYQPAVDGARRTASAAPKTTTVSVAR
jgi:tetratricopeptide (TPR) repeat protein